MHFFMITLSIVIRVNISTAPHKYNHQSGHTKNEEVNIEIKKTCTIATWLTYYRSLHNIYLLICIQYSTPGQSYSQSHFKTWSVSWGPFKSNEIGFSNAGKALVLQMSMGDNDYQKINKDLENHTGLKTCLFRLRVVIGGYCNRSIAGCNEEKVPNKPPTHLIPFGKSLLSVNILK